MSLQAGVEPNRQAVAEFPSFPRLPTEIRLAIWKAVCFIPRVIDVRAHVPPGAPKQAVYNYSKRGVPRLLHVCRESRLVGLKHYVLGFGSFSEGRSPEDPMPPRIYVNPLVDRTIKISSRNPGVRVANYHEKCKALGLTSRIGFFMGRDPVENQPN